MTMPECCPNADCWAGAYNYESCCTPEGAGNAACWGDVYTYNRCCSLTEPSTTWVDNLFYNQDLSAFYSFDEFYNDAQYGPDFGYYSTGRVMGAGKAAPDANEFAHFTTFPMAIAPHFGRVLSRNLLLMWLKREKKIGFLNSLNLNNTSRSLGLKEDIMIFQVVEMGAGSGQLGKDISDCVRDNCLRLPTALNNAWNKAFRYTILERSPALAERQRERGLEVIISDAQQHSACAVLKEKSKRGKHKFEADAVISNELIDAERSPALAERQRERGLSVFKCEYRCYNSKL